MISVKEMIIGSVLSRNVSVVLASRVPLLQFYSFIMCACVCVCVCVRVCVGQRCGTQAARGSWLGIF